MQGNPAASRKKRKDVAPTLSARTQGGGGLGTDFDLDGGLIPLAYALQAGVTRENPDSGPDGMGVREGVAYTLEARSEVQIVAARQQAFGGGNTSGPIDVSTALTAHGERMDFDTETFIVAGMPRNDVIAFDCKAGGTIGAIRAASGGSSRDYIAHTLGAEGFDASGDGTGSGTPLVPVEAKSTWAVRRLTPVECARLQGFPDRYLDITYRNKSAADGNQYKALGNSMAVPVMRWIGQRILGV